MKTQELQNQTILEQINYQNLQIGALNQQMNKISQRLEETIKYVEHVFE